MESISGYLFLNTRIILSFVFEVLSSHLYQWEYNSQKWIFILFMPFISLIKQGKGKVKFHTNLKMTHIWVTVLYWDCLVCPENLMRQ